MFMDTTMRDDSRHDRFVAARRSTLLTWPSEERVPFVFLMVSMMSSVGMFAVFSPRASFASPSSLYLYFRHRWCTMPSRASPTSLSAVFHSMKPPIRFALLCALNPWSHNVRVLACNLRSFSVRPCPYVNLTPSVKSAIGRPSNRSVFRMRIVKEAKTAAKMALTCDDNS
jgi:hypothetical protein